MEPLRPASSGESPQGSPEGAAASAAAAADPSLESLLKQSALGDRDAFARLYDATSARAYGLAVRVVRDPAQAEEVTQEAYLDVWRTSTRFDPERGSAISWLLTIVHRKAVDRVVRVRAIGIDGKVNVGSGVIVGPERIATACHVTRRSATITVTHGACTVARPVRGSSVRRESWRSRKVGIADSRVGVGYGLPRSWLPGSGSWWAMNFSHMSPHHEPGTAGPLWPRIPSTRSPTRSGSAYSASTSPASSG